MASGYDYRLAYALMDALGAGNDGTMVSVLADHVMAWRKERTAELQAELDAANAKLTRVREWFAAHWRELAEPAFNGLCNALEEHPQTVFEPAPAPEQSELREPCIFCGPGFIGHCSHRAPEQSLRARINGAADISPESAAAIATLVDAVHQRLNGQSVEPAPEQRDEEIVERCLARLAKPAPAPEPSAVEALLARWCELGQAAYGSSWSDGYADGLRLASKDLHAALAADKARGGK